MKWVTGAPLTCDSLERLSARLQTMKASSNGDSAEPIIMFDKDDEDTLDFVTASANLRSIVFGIETKSRFDIKQMAGNIIPAIATTNAIVAGLCVLEAYKVLRGDFSATKEASSNCYVRQPGLSNPYIGLFVAICTRKTPSF
jgi:ubiquitin-like 1-activating enzyme E1 B